MDYDLEKWIECEVRYAHHALQQYPGPFTLFKPFWVHKHFRPTTSVGCFISTNEEANRNTFPPIQYVVPKYLQCIIDRRPYRAPRSSSSEELGGDGDGVDASSREMRKRWSTTKGDYCTNYWKHTDRYQVRIEHVAIVAIEYVPVFALAEVAFWSFVQNSFILFGLQHT